MTLSKQSLNPPLTVIPGDDGLGRMEDLIEAERTLFEADAAQYGFNMTRYKCGVPEPWAEYADVATGHRWGGWLAARALPPNVKVRGWPAQDIKE